LGDLAAALLALFGKPFQSRKPPRSKAEE
jgi:hypothetical protein